MQKKIIALAIAGLVSGAAFAQTNVTIYGVADAAYTYSKLKLKDTPANQPNNRTFSGIEAGGRNGNRIGFRGEEALGNGLKAIFTFEFGNDIDVSSGLTSTRLSFVGLSGNFGSVTLGRQAAPTYLFMGATNANDITSVNPTNLALGDANVFETLSTGGTARWNNSIAYTSPKWSGFDIRAIYSFGEQTRDSFGDASTDASKIGLGVRYANGPLYLTALYQGVNESGTKDIDCNQGGVTASNCADSVDGWVIGGSYDFKVVKVFANYAQEKYDDDDSRGRVKVSNSGKVSGAKHTLWSVGVLVPVSQAGVVTAEYMQFKSTTTAYVDADGIHAMGKAKGFGLGYEHSLSKRTILYTAVSRIKNDKSINWTHAKTRGAIDGAPIYGNSTNFQTGIRHNF